MYGQTLLYTFRPDENLLCWLAERPVSFQIS